MEGELGILKPQKKILSIGFEKIVINTAAGNNPELITTMAEHSGNQSIIASIDVKRNIWGKYNVHICDERKKIDTNPMEWAKKVEKSEPVKYCLHRWTKMGLGMVLIGI